MLRKTLLLPLATMLLAPLCAAQTPFGPPPLNPAAASPSGEAPPTESANAEPALMAEAEVIARINGQVVSASDVLWQVNLTLEGQEDGIPPSERPKVRRQLMQRVLMGRLIDTKMLYGDFRRKVPMADIPAIQQTLAAEFTKAEVPLLMKQTGVEDPRDLPARLVELGTSMRARRADFYQNMIARSWLTESVDVNKVVRPDELLEYYQEHAAEYDYPTQARWEELMVRFDRFGGDKPKAYDALAAIGNRAYRAAVAQPDKSQPAFAEIAKAESHGYGAKEGGEQDWTTKGSLAAERVDEALFTVPVGEMSPIIESDNGFHIVRVLERREAGRTPFTEVQREIEEKIRAQRGNRAFAKRLNELRREAQIWTVFDGHIDPIEYAAQRRGAKKRR